MTCGYITRVGSRWPAARHSALPETRHCSPVLSHLNPIRIVPYLSKVHFQYYGPLRYDNLYRGADKSLARPGMKQARKHVRDARDFNNIETRAVKFFFPARQGSEGNSRHYDRNISLFPSWSG